MSRGLGLGWLPIAFVFFFLTGLFISYGLAVYNGSIDAVWPYISDTGVDMPETCIFSLFFNICAFMSLSIMFIRFRYIMNAVRESDPKMTRLSKVNMGLGVLSVLGFLLVANFPEYVTGLVHTAGAVSMFLFGLIYVFIDCHVTHGMCFIWNSRKLFLQRVVIATMAGVFFVSTFVSEIIAWVQWVEGEEPPDATWMLYEEWYPGYTAHLVSTISEWIMAGFFLSYFLTYIHEFRRFDVELRIHLQPCTVTQPLKKPTLPSATEKTRLVGQPKWIPTTEQGN